jgi:PKD repeat protein
MTEPAAYSPINLVNVSLFSSEPDPRLGGAHLNIPVDVHQPSATVSLFTGQGPIAHAGKSQTVDEDTPTMFNASHTTPITNGTQFHWTFDDNGPKKLDGIAPTYSFDIPGVHEVFLKVTDEGGLQSNATVTITVRDTTPPVAVIALQDANTYATINAGQTINVGQLITFDAYSKSYDPENGTLQPNGYTWDMGDGTIFQYSNSIVHYSYNETGTHNITLTVTDARSNLSSSTTMQITVGGQDSGTTSQKFSLPPTVLWTVIILTAVVIVGSAFWLTGTTLKKPSLSRSENDETDKNEKRGRSWKSRTRWVVLVNPSYRVMILSSHYAQTLD